MSGTGTRYLVPPWVASPEPSPSSALEGGSGAGGGPLMDGYGVEVVGRAHRPLEGGAPALVYMPANTRYTLRLSNANGHLAMVRVEVDEVHVGTMLLNSHTYCDLERPLDRPLAFTFNHTDDGAHTPDNSKTSTKNASASWSIMRRSLPLTTRVPSMRTLIKCTFQPELGAKTIQFNVHAHHLGTERQYQIAHDTTIAELFRDLRRDFGIPAKEDGWVLMHWANAEHDSSVGEVLTASQQTPIGKSIGKGGSLRQMSLVIGRKAEVHDDLGAELVIDLSRVPRFDDVIQNLRRAVTDRRADDNRPVYFLTGAGRVLGSTSWITGQTCIYELLHKDELLGGLSCLKINVTHSKPKGLFSVFVRVLKGDMYELQVTKDTTFRELRFQMAAGGAPWGMDDPNWLFCGALIESSRPLSYYGIRPSDTLDVMLRIQSSVHTQLRLGDPIAVESENPISSARLLKLPPGGTGDKRPMWHGTTLNGRNRQQFIEVDAIATDEQFHRTVLLALAPDDEDFNTAEEQLKQAFCDGTGRRCEVM